MHRRLMRKQLFHLSVEAEKEKGFYAITKNGRTKTDRQLGDVIDTVLSELSKVIGKNKGGYRRAIITLASHAEKKSRVRFLWDSRELTDDE